MTVLDRFADLLADGLSVPEASRRMGMTPATGRKNLQRIKAKLGWQAQ